jgi:hypothetical protein
MPAVHTFKLVRLTVDELLAEAKLRFGDDPMKFAFQCPTCKDVATLSEWQAIGDQARAGQDCIGRASASERAAAGINRKGCDWAAYGLFRGPWEIVLPADGDKPERSIAGFPLAGEPAADGPVARYLAAKETDR